MGIQKKDKPAKPYPTFPLYPHSSGSWAARIDGKIKYFGGWSDPDAALRKYETFIGKNRNPDHVAEPTLQDLANDFLNAQRIRLNPRHSERLSPRTFHQYRVSIERFFDSVDKKRVPSGLTPDDFAVFDAAMSKTRGIVGAAIHVRSLRRMFNWSVKNRKITSLPFYGEYLKRPSPAALRRIREPKRNDGTRMFTPEQIQKLLSAASVQMRAMILLGVNAGCGNSDLANLSIDAIDLNTGWLSYARSKTAIFRRVPLWPETIEAIREVLKIRKNPRRIEDRDILFVTEKLRHRWIRFELTNDPKKPVKNTDAIGRGFIKLRNAVGIPKGTFYNFRRITQTIGDNSLDAVAVRSIMGHADNSMSDIYRIEISDERLKTVTDTIHKWLFRT